MVPTSRLSIHLQPRAAHDRIVGRHGDALKVQVHAAPIDGAANDALVALLASELDVPRRCVRIVQGASSRHKIVEVSGITSIECEQRLAVLTRVDKKNAGD